MNTLYAIKLGGEDVQNDRSVSTGVFPLNGRDSSYITSAKETVLKLPTFGRKSTNIQSTDFHNPAGHQYKCGLPLWRPHEMPLQAVTCHWFVEAFIIISQVTSQCVYSTYHVLTCSITYVMFISISCHTISDIVATNSETRALELFLLHKELNHSTLANKCH